jgi:hypothetical protein
MTGSVLWCLQFHGFFVFLLLVQVSVQRQSSPYTSTLISGTAVGPSNPGEIYPNDILIHSQLVSSRKQLFCMLKQLYVVCISSFEKCSGRNRSMNSMTTVFGPLRRESISAGIFKQSLRARNRVGIGLSYRPARLNMLAQLNAWNRFLGSLKV